MSGIKNPGRVVVTGAGSGIGKATASAFAERGAQVICVDIDEIAAKETAAECGRGAVHYECDVSDSAAVVQLADSVEHDHGPVDVLVNNAGVGLSGDFLDSTIEDWKWIRSINLDGVVHGCHAFGTYMRDRRRGHVVNVSSGLGYMPSRRTSEYCATKAGVLMLSETLRSDWRRHGVGVTAICPGVINTPILAATRLNGVDEKTHSAFAWAFQHGHSPDTVAGAIVNGVAKNRGVVPVGIEASLGYATLRFVPGFVRDRLGAL